MIEAQQRIIDRTPDPVIMPTAHDRGVTIFNRLVARLAEPIHHRWHPECAYPARGLAPGAPLFWTTR
jgi:hypothetical protein